MRLNFRNRQVEFWHEDGMLIRRVSGTRISNDMPAQYEHFCLRRVFEETCIAIQADKDPTRRNIATAWSLPFSQVDVACVFLIERGIVEIRRGVLHALVDDVLLDGMCEFTALAVKADEQEPTSAKGQS
jgi:hypothetical protein